MLMDMNHGIADLMDVLEKDFIYMDFEGSISIKKVLPVVCPDLI